MGKIHKLGDTPQVFKTVKTTIKDGEIVRVPVWKNTMGQEMRKIGSKFVPKDNFDQNFLYGFNNMQQERVYNDQSDVDNFQLGAIIIYAVVLTILLFYLGFVFGKRSSPVEKLRKSKKPIITKSELVQLHN